MSFKKKPLVPIMMDYLGLYLNDVYKGRGFPNADVVREVA